MTRTRAEAAAAEIAPSGRVPPRLPVQPPGRWRRAPRLRCSRDCGRPFGVPVGRALAILAATGLILVHQVPDTTARAARISQEPGAQRRSFRLDVGAEGDSDAGSDMYLYEGRGVSGRLVGMGRTYRSLDQGRLLYFDVRPTGVHLAANGVPYQHAFLDVTYLDSTDEADCRRVSGSRSYCRPRVDTRLLYGDEPSLEWHTLGGFGGLADGEWKTTRFLLEANPWQTLRAIDGAVAFRMFHPNRQTDRTPIAIDSLGLTFVDEATYLASREADRADRGLIRSDYVETGTLARAGDEDSYVIYVRNYLEKIYPNTVPRASEIGRELATFEIAGEAEPVTFGIHAFDDLSGVRVQASDLRGPAGVIPARQMHLNLVRPADKRWMYSYDQHYGTNPWYLDDMSPFSVVAGSSQQVWVTIHVPEGTASGVYRGDLTISPQDLDAQSLPLVLTVYELELKPPDATPYLYHSPYLTHKHFAARRSISAEDMAAHDINPIIYLDAAIDVDTLDVDLRDAQHELAELKALGILPPEPRVGISDNARSLWRMLCPDGEDFGARCSVFDEAYAGVLRTYRALFRTLGVTPALSFTDEPGVDPEKRAITTYLNRLAKQVGLRTWVTYYPNCERPLAGHVMSFDDLAGDVSRSVPRWLAEDPHLAAHWDFTDGPRDLSANRNHGSLEAGAVVADGELQLATSDAHMLVPHSESLSFTTAATISFWFRPAACHSLYATRPVAKWSGTDDANYVMYYFGDYDGQYPENVGRVGWYANIDGVWTGASGYTNLDCVGGMERWYHVLWTYDAEAGGTLYVNGVPFPGSRTGELASNAQPLVLGRFVGALDDVIMLDRALDESEVLALARELNGSFDQRQAVRLRRAITDVTAVPTRLTMSLGDELPTSPELETEKSLEVNRRTVWSSAVTGEGYPLITIELGGHLIEDQTNVIDFTVVNGHARREQLALYFLEDAWRDGEWTVTGAAATDHWRHSHQDDPSGSLAPMGPYLDDRVHAMRYVTKGAKTRTAAAGDSFSFYTTYPATQPVIANNRFLNGIYASAVGAEAVYVYAYGDWGPQPWDDTETSNVDRLGTATGRRGQNGYQLVLPSWEERVYTTVVYESLREGIEDSRLIATLEAAIAAHPGPLADQAQLFLSDLLARPSSDYWPRYMHADSQQPIHLYADRSREVLTDLAGDPGDYAVFDRIRAELVHHILRLRSQRPSADRPAYLPIAQVAGSRAR